MIKPTSSLFAKILSWFFLNLILVVAALAVFFAFQPQVNLYAIFGQQGSNRLQTAAMLIAHDLNQTSPTNWSEVLARHAAIHQVDFVLVLENGSRFSSKDMKLPEEVIKRVRDALPPKPPPRHGPPHPAPPRRSPPQAKVRRTLLPQAKVRRPLSSTILKGDLITGRLMMHVTCRKKGPAREYRPCTPVQMIKDRI